MELVLLKYYCPVMSKAGQMKQANFVKAFLTQANRVAEASFHTCRYVPTHKRLGTNEISEILILRVWGLFFESPGNFSGPKSQC